MPRFFNLRRRLEKDLHHCDTLQRLRLDVFNVVNRCRQRAFGQGDDSVRHLLGIEAAVVPNNADDGYVNVWKNVGWGTEDANRAQYQQRQGENDEGIRPASRQRNNAQAGLSAMTPVLQLDEATRLSGGKLTFVRSCVRASLS